MNKKCSNCRLVNYPNAIKCVRCESNLVETGNIPGRRLPRIIVRGGVCLAVLVAILVGFYLSLLGTSKSLGLDEKAVVREAIGILKDRGFSHEVFWLEQFTAYRSSDNWLNASVAKENAYAATNFPFEIMTIYPDFFTYPVDGTERAAILLHEARHLQGDDETEAYEFVWKNRQKLGWTIDKYSFSPVWRNVRLQTSEYAPNLFVCEGNPANDCTESSSTD